MNEIPGKLTKVMFRCPRCNSLLDHVVSVEYRYRTGKQKVIHYECPLCGEIIARTSKELAKLVIKLKP